MTPFLWCYIATWLAACMVAGVLMWRQRRQFALFGRDYRRYLASPWKLSSFAIAFVGIVWIAP